MKRWDENEVGRLVEQALSEYSGEVPREGLERRILANLASAPAEKRPGWWVWLAIPAGAALVIVVALWWSASSKTHRQPEVAKTPPPSVVNPPLHRNQDVLSQVVHTHKPSRRRETRVAKSSQPPRLPTFPSHTDETQARLALRFVQGSPNEAQEVVKEEKRFRDLVARNTESPQDQQQETSEER